MTFCLEAVVTFDLICKEGGRGKIIVVKGTAQDLDNDCTAGREGGG